MSLTHDERAVAARKAKSHLDRAAGMLTDLERVAQQAQEKDGSLPYSMAQGMLEQAKVHAMIGHGYAELSK